ncbi:c-type cytochrome [Paracoccus sp. 22332]|uniref:c-type cytochrome n=1 Tax=Paracoccus sp. 22332 TaxID=3453913 RepID=UPI003F874117
MKLTLCSMVSALCLIGHGAFAETVGDAAAGEKAFRKCAMCHTIGDGAVHRTGPELNKLFGRVAGTDNGFKYSDAMIAAGKDGLVWTPEKLDEFITNARKMVPGTKMTLASVRNEQERANIVAYIAQFSDQPKDGDSPAPAAEGAAAPAN